MGCSLLGFGADCPQCFTPGLRLDNQPTHFQSASGTCMDMAGVKYKHSHITIHDVYGGPGGGGGLSRPAGRPAGRTDGHTQIEVSTYVWPASGNNSPRETTATKAMWTRPSLPARAALTSYVRAVTSSSSRALNDVSPATRNFPDAPHSVSKVYFIRNTPEEVGTAR